MATVMVVDDAKIMRINLKNMLEDLGHEVVAEAQNGYFAIENYKESLPDIVTMDITMPPDRGIMNGIDAVKHIREFHPAAKIIMITSHGEEEKVIQAIQNGASNYLLKPIDVNKLDEVIEKVLSN